MNMFNAVDLYDSIVITTGDRDRRIGENPLESVSCSIVYLDCQIWTVHKLSKTFSVCTFSNAKRHQQSVWNEIERGDLVNIDKISLPGGCMWKDTQLHCLDPLQNLSQELSADSARHFSHSRKL